jgi:hypothetical protein
MPKAEALSEHQTIVTQPIFHGLQGEYLKARQLNPEFLAKNLANIENLLSAITHPNLGWLAIRSITFVYIIQNEMPF